MFDKCAGRVRGNPKEKKRYDIVIKKGTDAVADSALADSFLVVSVTLPDTVTVIENHAFADCHALEKVSLPPKLKRIGDSAFANCPKLKDNTYIREYAADHRIKVTDSLS